MYLLTYTNTRRTLPCMGTGHDLSAIANRAHGEGLEYHKGGDEAVLVSADGKTLAIYTHQG